MKPQIVMTDKPPPDAWHAMVRGLTEFNEAHAGPENFRFLVLLLKAPDTQAITGGLWARTLFEWLYVNVLYIPENHRRSGLGTRLMRMAESEALARGCRGALVDTFSFQARPFYERLGYRVFGTVQDYPPGFACHFLQKRLVG
jgi:GNAT superfamily N-acetyltransferase